MDRTEIFCHVDDFYGAFGKDWTGKDSIGCFFGFKLHLVVNDIGEILSFRITRANVDARSLMQGLFGRIYGERGYISQD